MAWFKTDDKLHSHKKVAKAGAAMALWVVAGSWCADQLTDGFVPDYMVSRLMAGGDDMAESLVVAGLWIVDEHEGDQGWRFNDWDDYQPTREEVESKRKAARHRMRRVRSQGGDTAKDVPDHTGARSDEVRANTMRSDTNPDPTRPVPVKQEPAANADPPSMTTVEVEGVDNPMPVRGKDLSKAIEKWACEAGHERPSGGSWGSTTPWLLGLVGGYLGTGKYSHGAKVALIGEYVAATTQGVVPPELFGHLARLVADSGGDVTFVGVRAAVKNGAGLDGKHVNDPRALTRYAKTVIDGLAAKAAA